MIAILPLFVIAGGIAIFMLVSGLRSGEMRCYPGAGLKIGRASRAEHPARFWAFAWFNLFWATVCTMMAAVIAFGGGSP